MIRLIAAVLLLWSGAANAGCLDAEAACEIPTGTYHIERPPGIDPAVKLPAVAFLHGWGASGAATLSNRGMVDTLLARGYAVIAPDGRKRDSGTGRTWDFHPARSTTAMRDEAAFLDAVADDAAARFAIDRDRVILAGFSIGGSTTSYIACKTPTTFAAFAPVAGSFWNPLPETCAGPVRLLHVHGWTDTTVPPEGRRLRVGITQGVCIDGDLAADQWLRAAPPRRVCPHPRVSGAPLDGLHPRIGAQLCAARRRARHSERLGHADAGLVRRARAAVTPSPHTNEPVPAGAPRRA